MPTARALRSLDRGALSLLEEEMTRQFADIKSMLDEYEVKFVRLAFCDILGSLKNIAIMSDELEGAVEHGISFDASSIEGFGRINESDLFLKPDLDSFAILPWRPATGAVARFYCQITYPDGRPFEGCGRSLLSSLEDKAIAKGYSMLLGPECEFYLFETDSEGKATTRPLDRAGYFDVYPVDRGENVRREICFALEDMGIKPERSHHESGPGQNEIDFRASSPLKAADDFLSFKMAVKSVSSAKGLFASFLPKPLRSESGSGLHINMSLRKDGRALFKDFATSPDKEAAAFMAGVMRRMEEVTVFLNPLPSSYERLGRSEAPGRVSWSCQNRSSLIRVPAAQGEGARMEVRSADGAVNPYFAFALLLSAGFEGIEEGLCLPPAYDRSSYDEEASKILRPLPKSLLEAVERAETSDFVKSVIPSQVLGPYLRVKEKQALAWESTGDKDAFELEHYLPYI